MDLHQTKLDNSFERKSKRLGFIKRRWVRLRSGSKCITRRGKVKSIIIGEVWSWSYKVVYPRKACFRYKIQRVNCEDIECVLYCKKDWRLWS